MLDDLISSFNKLNFFNDERNFTILHEALLEDDLSQEFLINTYNRYILYLTHIKFTKDSKIIKYNIENFINLYDDYSSNQYRLFKLSKTIDSTIMDKICSSKVPQFWF